MLTEIYIGALLVDEELADQVWEAWDKGEIDAGCKWLYPPTLPVGMGVFCEV